MWKLFFSGLLVLVSNYALANGDCLDKVKLANSLNLDSSLVAYVGIEIPSCNNLKLFDDYVGFYLDENDTYVNNGVRSEVSLDFPFHEGDVVEYSWSVFFPSLNSPGVFERGWWVIAQWHDQPDRNKSETWKNFPHRAPPVSIFVEQYEGGVYIGVQSEFGDKFHRAFIPAGEWVRLKVVIKWSSSDDGYASLVLDENLEVASIFFGKTMHNSYQHYLKIGQYRSPNIGRKTLFFARDLVVRKML